MSNRAYPQRQRGFTFLELITSLALILILMVLLFPVLLRGRDSARRASCMSNLSQMVGALHLYAQDNDGRFPPTENDWTATYGLYTKNRNVFTCPDEPRKERDRFKPGTEGLDAQRRPMLFSSYSYRAGLANDDPAEESIAQDWGNWHDGGRCVGYLGGSVRWQSVAEAPPWPQSGRPLTTGAPLVMDLNTWLGQPQN